MGECKICKRESSFISSYLGLCLNCILSYKEAKKIVLEAHAKSRREFGLPETVPKSSKGLRCGTCGNSCRIPENEKGYCGLVENRNNRLMRNAGTPDKGLCEWYFDPHVTNCVASWVCPAGTGCGYPRFAVTKGPEFNYYNLSVFYGTCNFNCLFCQNWHFRNNLKTLTPIISAKELANKVNEKVTCICYFGGDPNPQLPHAIETSRIAIENSKGILRICMETNGNANKQMLKKFAEIAFESGGSIKFDLKCFGKALSFALSGVSNKTTYKNFKILVKYHKKRPEVPFLHASTLLIPGYVEEEQIKKISEFIAKLDRTIPYSLLAFWPTFFMNDLPLISKEVAEKCLKIAKENGLERVRIGNVHLLR
ncbi:MAG: radical SAM protein [Candidatus Aenigmarchaeota archaeon]|nr:radical SAM protein [Candidatus Aenigmarchaeota archaeon]